MFSRAGSLSATVGAGSYPMPFTGTIVGVIASVGTPPTGTSLVCDVNKNGTTVFTSQANRPAIAAGASSTAVTAVPDVTAVTAGDLLSVDIDAVGNSTAGSDLTVVIELQVA